MSNQRGENMTMSRARHIPYVVSRRPPGLDSPWASALSVMDIAPYTDPRRLLPGGPGWAILADTRAFFTSAEIVALDCDWITHGKDFQLYASDKVERGLVIVDSTVLQREHLSALSSSALARWHDAVTRGLGAAGSTEAACHSALMPALILYEDYVGLPKSRTLSERWHVDRGFRRYRGTDLELLVRVVYYMSDDWDPESGRGQGLVVRQPRQGMHGAARNLYLPCNVGIALSSAGRTRLSLHQTEPGGTPRRVPATIHTGIPRRRFAVGLIRTDFVRSATAKDG
jgi:hypothetical protein